MRKRLVISLVLLSLFSCNQKPVVLLVDKWWEAAYDDSVNLKSRAFWAGIKSFKTVDYFSTVSEQDAFAYINEKLKKHNELNVLISPIFFSYLKNWDFGEKNINYIILNGFYDDTADNVIAVYSFREDVYRAAGEKAARYSEAHGDCAVAAVFYNDTEVRRSERDSFFQGFKEAGVSGELLISDQQTYSGGEKLKSFIKDAPGKDVGLFFFSASSLNAFCLEQASPLSIPMSGENLNSLVFHNELIEFSIDDDMMKIVETALELALDGEVEDDFPVIPVLKDTGNHF
ncbi:MAG: hypothetical protein EH225_13065 [Calditrichaeota bacterium]|nr:MAG: hypothetical protein EH225_13065 [Calditrichota bacterium]